MSKHRRILAVATATALAVGVAAADAASATPSHQPGPSPKARSAGISQRGLAWMGWAQQRQQTPQMAAHAAPQALTASTKGLDVSHWQGSISWTSYWNQGYRFAYTKATEGNYYTDDTFSQHYSGSYKAGFIRGAYHFGIPDGASGAAQADYFIAHGGGWSKDGKTLPGVLDIEYNPYGASCYGLSTTAMVSWIKSFTQRYKARTGRDAVIYTTAGWWNSCTGSSKAFAASNPLWVARYASSPGTLPAGWPYYTFWQYSSKPIDADLFNGDLTRLKALATG